MSVTRKEMEAAAAMLIRYEVEDFEFCSIYENEDFDDYTEGEKLGLLKLITTAEVAVSWKDSE